VVDGDERKMWCSRFEAEWGKRRECERSNESWGMEKALEMEVQQRSKSRSWQRLRIIGGERWQQSSGVTA
jgi:hypothetical protein